MTLFLVHWAIFLFLIGLILSLPVAGIYYFNMSLVRTFFTNPRKLKSAHLDYFMQAFSIGIVYILELGMNANIPIYIVIPLAFGTFFNPFIFLLESTPLYKTSVVKTFYTLLKGISPASLFFAWFALLFLYLPLYFSWLLAGFTIILLIAFLLHIRKAK